MRLTDTKPYVVCLQRRVVLGTPGFEISIFLLGRLVASGWSAGMQADARAEAAWLIKGLRQRAA